MGKPCAYLKKDDAVHSWIVLQGNRIENLRHETATAVAIDYSAEKRNLHTTPGVLRCDHMVKPFLRKWKPIVGLKCNSRPSGRPAWRHLGHRIGYYGRSYSTRTGKAVVEDVYSSWTDVVPQHYAAH